MTSPTTEESAPRGVGGRLTGFLFALFAGPAAIGAHWLVFRTLPKERDAEEYFLTGLLAANYDWITGLVFAAAGFAVARRFATAPVVIGLGMVALFPIGMVIEMVRSSTSHNLLPFELVMYGLYAVPAMLGAWAARRLARR